MEQFSKLAQIAFHALVSVYFPLPILWCPFQPALQKRRGADGLLPLLRIKDAVSEALGGDLHGRLGPLKDGR